MTKTQKTILAILGTFTVMFFGGAVGYVWTTYRAFATKPLGPAIPVVTQAMPPVWTVTPGTPSDTAMLVPTLPYPTNTPEPLCGGPSTMNILAIGSDRRSDDYIYGNSDIIRVVRVDFITPKVTVLAFPRDLWVEIPYIADNLNGFDHGRLNQAYLYGQPGDGFAYWDDPSQGPGLLALTLNLNFGVNIDHYLAVNMRTFEKVINAIDGITVNVPDLETAYNTGLKIGKHQLNGAQALKVARNRTQGAVFERTSNQNLILCAMREKVLSPNIVTQIPALIESFKDNIQTDFTPDQLSQLACLGTKLPVENIAFANFPKELLKEDVRVFEDPAYPNGLFTTAADFNILRDYVTKFQAGTWPQTESSTAEAETEAEEASSSFCP